MTKLPWLVLLAACGGGYGGGGGFGATVGGVKDLRFARALVAKGQVPPADALLVEAMFAEHDLPVEGAPCARTLCLRGAAGYAPELDGTARGWAQVGLSSTVDPAIWQAPETTYIFTVDVSGSMSWGGDTTPAGLAQKLMHRLTDQLRDNDAVAIVTFGSDVHTKLALTAGLDKAKISAAIDDLSEDGSTDMESGLERAFALGATAVGHTGQVRVILFTDTQPNVGATSPTAFQTMVAKAAAGRVETTVMALGTGIGPEVLRAMASLRGANAFSLTKHSDIDTLMTDEYPYFTTPIAYGLRVNAALEPGWAIDRGLGFPAASDAQQIGLKAESVFLSKHRGALLVALTPEGAGPANLAGRFSLAYTERDGTAVTDDAAFAYDGAPLDDRGQWFAQHGTARTVALGLLIEAIHEAAVAYADDPTAARQGLESAVERFTADAAALGDEDLATEVDFANALLALVANHAPQGTLYGQ